MTRFFPPHINPNFSLGCHPPTLKEHFQDLNRQGVDVDIPISVQIGHFGPRKPKARKTVFQRLSDKRFLGKLHLVKFLYQKQLRLCSHRTLSNYCIALTFFLRFAQKIGRTSVEELTADDLGAFVEHEQDRGLSPATLSLRLHCFYNFARYLEEEKVLPADRFARKIRVKRPDVLPRAMAPADVKLLLAVIGNARDRAMILVLLRSGLRIGELLGVRMEDVRLDEKKILVWEGEKNLTGRTVCLSEDACCALERWFERRDPRKTNVFYAQAHSSMSYTTAREIHRKYIEKAGLAGKGYTLHSLRHTFATDLLNAGMRLECLQQLLGHNSLEMTLRYARLTDRTREDEYFKAMAVIEGETENGPDRLDCALPPASEAPELVAAHDPKLS